jgi:hypothetical protein
MLTEYFATILIENNIELAFFHRIGHLGSDFLMYQVAKTLNVKTLILNSTSIPGRFYYIIDVEDFGLFNNSNQIWTNHEHISLKAKQKQIMNALKKIPHNINENFVSINSNIIFEKDKRFSYLRTEDAGIEDSHVNIINAKQNQFLKYYKVSIQKFLNYNINYIYFPLQLQPEMTTSGIGDKYSEQLLAIEELHEMIPKDWKIYVKENPKQTFFQRGPWFYDRLKGMNKVVYLPIETNSQELIEKSKFVALVTGSAGYESILKGKPCLVFGNPWYKSLPGVFHINYLKSLDEILNCKIDMHVLEKSFNDIMSRTGKGYILHNTKKRKDPNFDDNKNIYYVSESIKRIIYSEFLDFLSEDIKIENNTETVNQNNSSSKLVLMYETDWLASRPVFYNEKTSQISHNINDVIDLNNIEFHPEGLNNYLDFGYSVFGQTPVKHVKFLPPCSRITKDINGKISIEHSTDPVEKWIGHESHEDDVLHEIFKSVRYWEKNTEGEIILPLSGGYDSRLLGLFVKDKSRIRAFTYGLSDKQNQSFEVVYAKTISKILSFDWQQIELGNYHNYFNYWLKHFGISTHAHGMYHIEFYKKILEHVNGSNPFLSGIFGDVWAGNVGNLQIDIPSDIFKLGYTHGMSASSKFSMLPKNNRHLNNFFEKNRKALKEPLFQTTWLIRLKMILISYLISIPESFGFKVWSPFLDEKIALGMATLPSHRKKDRIWQTDFFKKHNLNIEAMNIKADKSNTLNYQAIRNNPPSGLSVDILGEIISPHYIRLINAKIKEFIKSDIKPSTLNKNDNDVFKYYCAYLTLKPIEYLLSKNIKK